MPTNLPERKPQSDDESDLWRFMLVSIGVLIGVVAAAIVIRVWDIDGTYVERPTGAAVRSAPPR
jgi:hypothetical protein